MVAQSLLEFVFERWLGRLIFLHILDSLTRVAFVNALENKFLPAALTPDDPAIWHTLNDDTP
ncbi:MAG TPA: hypothetical protein VMF10_13255 [Candidatus Aquilonibacter sp.]|nr:hypothetical protein [Candidatus Aquilonibacter sp.]